jgi:hypothetical protein
LGIIHYRREWSRSGGAEVAVEGLRQGVGVGWRSDRANHRSVFQSLRINLSQLKLVARDKNSSQIDSIQTIKVSEVDPCCPQIFRTEIVNRCYLRPSSLDNITVDLSEHPESDACDNAFELCLQEHVK